MPFQTSYNADGSFQNLVTGADAQPYNWYNAYYTSGGQLSGYWLSNTDGTFTSDSIDYDNTKSYSFLQISIDAHGQATSAFTNNDDGTHTLAGYDTTNAQSYAAYYATIGADGQTRSIFFLNDDNSYRSVSYDYTNGSSWSTFTADYTAGNALLDVAYKNDDGTSAYVQYDPSNVKSWSSYQNTYDANGVVTNELVSNRDGTALSIAHNSYDSKFNHVFDTIATLTNSVGVVLEETWNEANGAQYHIANVMSDDQITPYAIPNTHIYAPGHILAAEYSGTQMVSVSTYYDWSNTQPWSYITLTMNRFVTEIVTNDDGSSYSTYRGNPDYIYLSQDAGFPF